MKLEETGIVKDTFLTGLLKQCAIDNFVALLKPIREQAANWVLRLQTPTKHDEDWRFTDLSDLVATNFSACREARSRTALDVATQVRHPRLVSTLGSIASTPSTSQSHLVFVNGIYSPELSNLSALPESVFVGNLTQLPEKYRASIQKYLAKQHGAQEVFTALNTAGFADAAVIWVDANVVLETPIHLIFLSVAGETPSFSFPRTLIVAEKNSSVSVIEEYVGKEEGVYLTNAVTEICLQDNAEINHIRLQQETEKSYHIGKSAVSQSRDSRYTLNEINLGAKLSRHNPEILQQGEQTQTNLNALTVISGEQTADTHSIIALTKPYGTTNQLHKCIVGDRAHAVFNGKVFVPKEAQLTNAAQLNRNLLLSSKARVDTKPELQITADNVKCSHGATVSQLEAEEIFYLRSRGLNDNDARSLLIDAFAAEIIDLISIPSLREKLSRSIVTKTSN
ncbi:MAG: Fe-S cluster assembly protein SufD [Xenococcaceae cyanobacterium]